MTRSRKSKLAKLQLYWSLLFSSIATYVRRSSSATRDSKRTSFSRVRMNRRWWPNTRNVVRRVITQNKNAGVAHRSTQISGAHVITTRDRVVYCCRFCYNSVDMIRCTRITQFNSSQLSQTAVKEFADDNV